MNSLVNIKKLREETGAGFSDCQKALQSCDGDIEKAKVYLREKGISNFSKMSNRATSDGAVAVYISDSNKAGAVVEMRSETDFVSRNKLFQQLVTGVAQLACTHNISDVDALKKLQYFEEGCTVADKIVEVASTVGENVSLKRVAARKIDNGIIASYVHNALDDGAGKVGKIAVLLTLETDISYDKIKEFGKQLGMHIAASRPESIDIESLSDDVVAKERSIIMAQIEDLDKPEDVKKKMLEGRLKKYYQEVVLLEQTFVLDGKNKVSDCIKDKASELGGSISIKDYILFVLGNN